MDKGNKYKQLRQKAEALLKQKGIEKPEQYYDDIDKLVEELNMAGSGGQHAPVYPLTKPCLFLLPKLIRFLYFSRSNIGSIYNHT